MATTIKWILMVLVIFLRTPARSSWRFPGRGGRSHLRLHPDDSSSSGFWFGLVSS